LPLVRISLTRPTDPGAALAIGEAVHRAMVETINVPADDKFQIITDGASAHVVAAPEYLGIRHSSAVTIVQITLNAGRTVERKRALYARIADLLEAEHDIPRADVIISLIEVEKENWSFGDGIAQYAPADSSSAPSR
jgi:phenylpyruvate tautomerase PptA (4-oxalocrotonate tautomerase family)